VADALRVLPGHCLVDADRDRGGLELKIIIERGGDLARVVEYRARWLSDEG